MQVFQLLVRAIFVDGTEAPPLFQPGQKGVRVLLQRFDLFPEGSIQRIAPGIGQAAKTSFTMLLLLAYIAEKRLAVCGHPLGKLGVHPAAAAAPEQTGKQGLVASRLAVGLASVALQRLLNLYPGAGRDQARMLPHRNDPLVDGQEDGGPAFFLVGTIIGQDTPHSIEFLRCGEKLCLLLLEIPVSLPVCD